MADPITDPQSQDTISTANDTLSTVASASVGGQDDNTRILGRQIPTGSLRGTQTITGDILIKDPSTNNQVISLSGTNQSFNFTNPTTGINQIRIGLLPDGTYNMVVTPNGVSVDSAFQ
jgi:hypothetical protein